MTIPTNLPARSSNARTRRKMIAAEPSDLFSLSTARAQEPSTPPVKAKAIVATKAIHQEIDFKAEPRRIHGALLDSKQFAAFSGGRASEIHRDDL
jgi:hypothetical protein